MFEPQQIRLDKVLHISKFLLQLCRTLIMVQFGNLTNLLGVSPITLHIHNVIIKERVSICFQFQVDLITQKVINRSQLKNQQQNVMNKRSEREFHIKIQQFAPAVCFPLPPNSPLVVEVQAAT